MTITTVVLGGETLPAPNTYSKEVAYIGGVTVLANGKQRRQLVQANGVRRYVLGWTGLDSTAFGDLEDAWAAAVAAETSFTSPDGDSVNVVAPPEAQLSAEAYISQGTLLWRVSIQLEEAVT